MTNVVFFLSALCAIGCAIAVVRSRDLVHAVLWLAGALVSTAVVYAVLGASFLAGVQLLLYVGGVVTLMVVGVMITRRHAGIQVVADRAGEGRAMLVSVVLFGVTARAITTTQGLDRPIPSAPSLTPAALAHALLEQHALAFETLSMLLLAATVGAIVIARRRDAALEPARSEREEILAPARATTAVRP